MIAEIASEIRHHSGTFQSVHRYKGYLLTVIYLEFPEGGERFRVITLKLDDDSGHTVKQDLLLTRESEFKAKLLSKDLEKELAQCLEGLGQSLAEA